MKAEIKKGGQLGILKNKVKGNGTREEGMTHPHLSTIHV